MISREEMFNLASEVQAANAEPPPTPTFQQIHDNYAAHIRRRVEGAAGSGKFFTRISIPQVLPPEVQSMLEATFNEFTITYEVEFGENFVKVSWEA